jgi:hypothetical protein
MLSVVEIFLLVMLGGAAVVGFSPTSLADNPHRWWRMVAVVAVLAVAGASTVLLVTAENPKYNLLIRDKIALVLIVGMTPVLASVGSRGWVRDHKRVWLRTGVAFTITSTMTAATPLLVLLVHCTSGDCL